MAQYTFWSNSAKALDQGQDAAKNWAQIESYNKQQALDLANKTRDRAQRYYEGGHIDMANADLQAANQYEEPYVSKNEYGRTYTTGVTTPTITKQARAKEEADTAISVMEKKLVPGQSYTSEMENKMIANMNKGLDPWADISDNERYIAQVAATSRDFKDLQSNYEKQRQNLEREKSKNPQDEAAINALLNQLKRDFQQKAAPLQEGLRAVQADVTSGQVAFNMNEPSDSYILGRQTIGGYAPGSQNLSAKLMLGGVASPGQLMQAKYTPSNKP